MQLKLGWVALSGSAVPRFDPALTVPAPQVAFDEFVGSWWERPFEYVIEAMFMLDIFLNFR